MAMSQSNEYDELERPQRPYYVNQPPPLQSREPSLPTSPDQVGSPPPTIPSYNPSQRDSFPLSNRPDYISKMITERFGPGDLGGEDEVEEVHVAQPYLTPARSKSLETPPPEETTKVAQKQVERKKSSEVSSAQKKKSSTSTSAPSMPVRQFRETSPPAKTGEKKSSKGAPPPAQAAYRVQRKSPSPEYNPSGMRPTSPGKPPNPLKGFSPMRPYDGMQSPTEQGKKQKEGSTSSGGFKKLLRTISPKIKDQVSIANYYIL